MKKRQIIPKILQKPQRLQTILTDMRVIPDKHAIFRFFVSIFVVLAFGCGNKKGITYERTGQDGSYRILRRTFDERGDLTEEAELSKDSIRDGFYKKYASGKIESIGYYKGNR